MLTVNQNLSQYTLAAGEPFVMEVQLLDSAGRGIDIDDEAMFLTFYTAANRAIVTDYTGGQAQYEGVRLPEESAEFFRWAFDGRFSEAMFRLTGVRVELSQRLRNGRKVLATGVLTVVSSAISVPSLDGGQIADAALRVTIKAGAMLGLPPTFSVATVAFDGDMTPPTPAPAFTVPPAITGTPQVGQMLTGLDGTVTNGAVVSRRWLLNGTQVSTAQMYAAPATGSLVYEVTATGPGGTTVATSSAVTIVAAGEQVPYSLKPVGMNLGSEGQTYYGGACAWLDRSKAGTGWLRDDNGAFSPSNADGYPTAIPAGRPFIRNLYSVEGLNGDPTKQSYVFETTKTDATFQLVESGLTNIVYGPVVNGKRRITFDAPSPTPDGAGFYVLMKITALPTPYVAGVDFDRFFRADREAMLNSGEIFDPQFLARCYWGPLRFMDWSATNANLHETWAQRPTLRTCTWSAQSTPDRPPVGVPFEIQIALCNKLNRNGWFCLPVRCNDDFAFKFGQLLKALKPNLKAIVEFGNEDWNFSFSATYVYLAQLSPSIGTDDPAWGSTGHRGSQVVAMVCKGADYAPNVCPTLMTQTTRLEVTPGMFVGVDRALAEWADPANDNYNPEFAARFKEAKQLFPYGGIATYLSGINSVQKSTNPTADKAQIEAWADDNAAGGTTGLTQAFEHMRLGNKLTTGVYDTLAGAPASWSAALAPFIARGIVPVAYEGGFHHNADSTWADTDPKQANVVKLFGDISYDERAYQFYLDMHKLARDLGIVYDCHLSDYAPKYTKVGIWGVVPTMFSPTSPRERALIEFNNNPTASPTLILTLSTNGIYQVDANPKTTINVFGGSGLHTVTASNAASGRVLNAAGTSISGVLTTVESKLLTVSVNDEAGSGPKTKTEQQNVVAKPAGTRYIKIRVIAGAGRETPISAGGYLPMASELRFKNQDGSLISTNGVVASGDINGNPAEDVSKLIDGDTATNWVGAASKDNVILFDFGAGVAVKPYSIEIMDRAGSEPNAPGDFEIYATNDPATGTSVFRTQKLDGSGPGNAYFGNDGPFSGKYPNHLATAVLNYPA